jgi:hypothetical protein
MRYDRKWSANLQKDECELIRFYRILAMIRYILFYLSATIKKDKQSKKYFAIKHLIPTTHPQRIEKELSCLLRIG